MKNLFKMTDCTLTQRSDQCKPHALREQQFSLSSAFPYYKDPIHDDRLYPTTRDLINAKPLPLRVRIEEAHFSDHPGEAQEVGDIIEIKGVEKRPVPYDSENPPQKVTKRVFYKINKTHVWNEQGM